jgi:hypothetical protein
MKARMFQDNSIFYPARQRISYNWIKIMLIILYMMPPFCWCICAVVAIDFVLVFHPIRTDLFEESTWLSLPKISFIINSFEKLVVFSALLVSWVIDILGSSFPYVLSKRMKDAL